MATESRGQRHELASLAPALVAVWSWKPISIAWTRA